MKAEIAVIGSGPGGAVTACLLAEAGRDVLLIEEGAHWPLDSAAAYTLAEMTQKYRNGGITAAMGNPKVQYVEGRCVGGGSEINSGLYHRTPPELLEIWRREFALADLTTADLMPHFLACERDLHISHLPNAAPAASLKLQAGAARLGWRSQEVPRWYKYDANGETKQSMTQTFIPRALEAGCRLLPNTRVRSLRREGNRWLLQADRPRSPSLEIVAESVFVCGGAVQTPALLRRSGIRQLVGNSLQMHPTVKAIARFADPINQPGMGVPVHQVDEFAPRYRFGGSVSTPPYLALTMLDRPDRLAEVERDWQRMAIYYAAITPEGRGTVRHLPGLSDPLVRYHLTDADLRLLSEALQRLAELLLEAGAQVIYPSLTGSLPIACRADLKSISNLLPRSRTQLMTVHLFASCPMGENRDRCVVDSFGRVHGFANLYVADASMLCTATGVNPQGTLVAIARRNALYFLGL